MAVTQGYRRIFDDPQVLVRLPHLTGDMRAADFADLWTTSSQDGGVETPNCTIGFPRIRSARFLLVERCHDTSHDDRLAIHHDLPAMFFTQQNAKISLV